MDEKIKKEYIKNLPKSIQDVVFESEWEKRTIEIGKKYSLSDVQIDNLADDVLLVLIGTEKAEELQNNIMNDLEISNIISEQITNELGVRVFEYAIKILEGKSKPQATTQPKVPEIKPQNLPMVEKGESVRVNPAPPTPRDTFKPVEQSQKPYGVPRFGMASIPPKVEVINMNQNNQSNSQNMMDNKLNSVATNIPVEMQKKPDLAPKIPTTKYNVDPYRESIN
jgi:hypothetical protein